MEQNILFFIELVKKAIQNQKMDVPSIKPDWDRMFEESLKHHLTAVLYPAILTLPEEFQPDQALLKKWKNTTMVTGFFQIKQIEELKYILKLCEEKNITALPFKGILLADLYPDPTLRKSCDADILTMPKNKEQIEQILLSRGYAFDREESMDTVYVYHKSNLLTIELHISLWGDQKGEREKRLIDMNLTTPSTWIETRACGMKVRTLGYMQHLIYLLYHIAKHFAISGIGIRHLADLTLFINYYKEQIDLKKFWKSMEILNYKTFCECIFSISIKYLGMDSDVMEGKRTQDRLCDEIMMDILDGGVFGNAKEERIYARNIIKPYLRNERKAPKNRMELLVRVVFPSSNVLYRDFIYAKKCPLLLPIAWFHRCLILIDKKIGKSKYRYSKKTADAAEYRLKLLKELEILKK